jgi:hypothetical protein
MLSGTWATWAIGVVFGAMAGFTVPIFGAPVLLLALASLALALLSARSLALLSGAFVGVGATWFAMLIRSQLACNAFDAATNQGCEGFGVEPFLAVSAVVLGTGLLLGLLAWRRRPARAGPAHSSKPLSR